MAAPAVLPDAAPDPEERPPQANLSVVISDLPATASLAQIARFAKTAGALATHPETGEPLILLSARNRRATVTFSYPEGANQAIELLDSEAFSEGCAVRVERAKREPFDFSVWKVALRQQRKFHAYLGAHEEEPPAAEQRRLRIMVLRRAFDPSELIRRPTRYGELVKDWTETCARFGKVTLVKPIEAHPEGVVIVRFDAPQAAAVAIGELDGAEYDGRSVTAELWDGTDLSVKESAEAEAQRIANYERYLEAKAEELV
jgi:hypothetical protein